VEIVLARDKNSTTNTTEMTSEVLMTIIRALIHKAHQRVFNTHNGIPLHEGCQAINRQTWRIERLKD